MLIFIYDFIVSLLCNILGKVLSYLFFLKKKKKVP